MKVGMVLEGGALRTIFSTGVLDAMLEKDLMTDYVVGVSAGIAYGVSYVSRQPRRNLEILTRFANDRRYMGLGNLLDRHNRSYFGLEFSYETIPNELVPFDYDTFAAFPGKVEAGVTNLETGKAEYLEVPRRDDSFLLLQATCAMPLMFPVYRLGGKPYLDGGAAETVPYPRAFEMGCDRAIVILTKPRSFVRKREKLLPVIERRYREYPNFCQTMRERAERDNRAREELFRLEKEGKVLVREPHRAGCGEAAPAVGGRIPAGDGADGGDPLLHGPVGGAFCRPSGASRAYRASRSPRTVKKAAKRLNSSWVSPRARDAAIPAAAAAAASLPAQR